MHGQSGIAEKRSSAAALRREVRGTQGGFEGWRAMRLRRLEGCERSVAPARVYVYKDDLHLDILS